MSNSTQLTNILAKSLVIQLVDISKLVFPIKTSNVQIPLFQGLNRTQLSYYQKNIYIDNLTKSFSRVGKNRS